MPGLVPEQQDTRYTDFEVFSCGPFSPSMPSHVGVGTLSVREKEKRRRDSGGRLLGPCKKYLFLLPDPLLSSHTNLSPALLRTC